MSTPLRTFEYKSKCQNPKSKQSSKPKVQNAIPETSSGQALNLFQDLLCGVLKRVQPNETVTPTFGLWIWDFV